MPGKVSSPPELSTLPPPSGDSSSSVVGIGGIRPTPKQLIHFYSPDEWEEFVLEYAIGLEQSYEQVKRIGGSNDRGADIAAFATNRGFEGEWDCLQCKHYTDALIPSDAYPEMFKIMRAVIEGHYAMPKKYLFMAPKGCGPHLSRLLSQPTKLRDKFLEKFSGEKALGAGLSADLVAEVKALATTVDYATFRTVELHEMLEVHSKTRYHAERFAVELPTRLPHPGPPASPSAEERRYIEQLLDVYSEHYGVAMATPAHVAFNAKASKHLSRQREAFYSAEALHLFARDSVHPGTFTKLQEQIFQGVIETHDRDGYRDGMDRLTTVLERAFSLDLKSPLIDASEMRDRQGICHQLANVDRFTWCDSP